MNIYNTVNKLAEELKNTEEYVNFKKAKQRVNQNLEYKNKIAEFEKARYEEQLDMMQKGINDENKMIKIQKMYKDLIDIPVIKEYFDAELKFNILLGDINKAISETVQDVMLH